MESGTIINQYRILSPIGKGGMGEVFLAEDTKLDRKVAIKFLNAEFSKDADKLGRFIQEAKAVSALNHPNILTVYEIGEKDDTNFIVTEFIDGRTLRESLSPKRTISLSKTLKIGAQVAEALSAAHKAGILHRDIKPENIMIRQDGYAKVLDFGLAKLTEQKPQDDSVDLEGTTKGLVKTNPGMVMGTVSYMSPEQARGKETDVRTDIWSLGVVLYEMLSGRLPFSGETVSHTIVSIMEKEPKLLENVPEELQRIVRKALTKDADMRYQTAKDLLIDLKNLRRRLDIQGELERSVAPDREVTSQVQENETQIYTERSIEDTNSVSGATSTRRVTNASSLEYAITQAKTHKLAMAVVALLLISIVSAVAYFGFFAKSGNQIESIAVMPFENRSGNPDIDYLCDGMTETLIKSLSVMPNMDVKPRSAVFRYKNKDADLKTISSDLNVQAILSGGVIQRGEIMTLSLELVDVRKNRVIWTEQYPRRQADIVLLQSEIARDISAKLSPRLSGVEETKVSKQATADPAAYQAYLRGRYYWNKRTGDDFFKAIEQFQTAIDRDPNYALALTGLADCYSLLPDYAVSAPEDSMSRAEEFARRAIAIDPQLAEPHATLGQIYYNNWQWADSEAAYRRAIELNPNYPTVYHWYSVLLFALGRNEEGGAMITRAHQLDPMSSIISQNFAQLYQMKNDHKTAIELCQKIIELDPNFPGGHFTIAWSYLKTGRNDEAIAEFQKAAAMNRGASFPLGELGAAFAYTGRHKEALELIKELEGRYRNKQADGFDLAMIYAALGEKDKAFEWLEKDLLARSGRLPDFRWGPGFEPLQKDPRFKDMLKRMRILN